MAYDSLRGRTVMFGGASVSYLTDTWEYDGTDWTQVQTPTTPVPGAMVFDPIRGRVVMSNGAETWEYDGSDWVQRFTVHAPPARTLHGMVFDSQRNCIVMYGGLSSSGQPLGGLWELCDALWIETHCQTEPGYPIWAQSMVCDANLNQVLEIGGIDITGNYSVGNYSIAFPPPVIASVAGFGVGCGAPDLRVEPASWSRPVLGFDQVTNVANVPSAFSAIAIGLSNSQIAGTPLPLPLDSYGLTGCLLYSDSVVLASPCAPVAPGIAQHTMAIPSNPSLVSLTVYLQAWAPAFGQNAAGIITSNALAIRIGDH
jgi:hypothetical protein